MHKEPGFLDMRVVVYGFDVFALDDGVAAVPVILWSRSCGYVVCVYFDEWDRIFDRRDAFAHC